MQKLRTVGFDRASLLIIIQVWQKLEFYYSQAYFLFNSVYLYVYTRNAIETC